MELIILFYMTPLIHAVNADNTKIVSLLLAKEGINVNIRDI